jgi:hypothetical protein
VYTVVAVVCTVVDIVEGRMVLVRGKKERTVAEYCLAAAVPVRPMDPVVACQDNRAAAAAAAAAGADLASSAAAVVEGRRGIPVEHQPERLRVVADTVAELLVGHRTQRERSLVEEVGCKRHSFAVVPPSQMPVHHPNCRHLTSQTPLPPIRLPRPHSFHFVAFPDAHFRRVHFSHREDDLRRRSFADHGNHRTSFAVHENHHTSDHLMK